MAEVASAYVTLIPSAKGFGLAAEKQINGQVGRAGQKGGEEYGRGAAAGVKKSSRLFAIAASGLAAVGISRMVKGVIGLEAEYSKTMNKVAATLDAPKRDMESLSDLAIKMGADTVFSAADASQAMLELARGGMKAATIQGGALEGTLTLAAAGELEMGEAANIAVKSMGQFNLEGKDMADVAAALAGGANASSASVQDMAQALAQGGLAANSVGFSIQETAAALAAFSNADLEGSDAGTSLKTMLDRLQPTTAKQSKAMRQLGIITKDGSNQFVKANGEFKSAAQIAELLRKGTEDLSQAESKRLITQAFGSDAQRAATIFAKEGASGLNELLKATSDTDAAQKMANASMKGTAGALEQLKGSAETAALEFGLMAQPYIVKGLQLATSAVNNMVPALKSAATFVKDNKTAILSLVGAMTVLVAITKVHAAVLAVQAAGGLLAYAKGIRVVAAATRTWAAVQWAINAALIANPIGIVIAALVAIGVALVVAYKKSDTFRAIVDKAFQAVGKAGQWLYKNAIKPAFDGIKKAIEAVAKAGVWLWNNALQPVFKFIVRGVAGILDMWAKMLRTLGKVPGFGWADKAADAMAGAADKARDMADGIKKIPTSKNVRIDVDVPNLQSVADRIDWVARPRESRLTITQVYANAGRNTQGGLQERAKGGPVAAGTPYLVGERGPEIMVPSSNGTIIPNHKLGTAATGQTFNIYETDDARSTAYEVARMQRFAGVA